MKSIIPTENGLLWGFVEWTKATDEKLHILDLPDQCLLEEKNSSPLQPKAAKRGAAEPGTRIPGESQIYFFK